MNWTNAISPAAALLLSPLMIGVIHRTKAFFAGRRGQPLLQLYYDIFKLMRKGATYSTTTTWVFRAGPIIGCASVAAALLVVPMGGLAGFLPFEGDLLFFAYLLCLARFFTVIAALDTGSSFEGMGASREVFFSALAEPVLFLCLACIVCETGHLSLSGMFGAVTGALWLTRSFVLALAACSLGIVVLTENARIPVDDPNTHLELTMIHEVMVLDHGGPDLALILYASALKLWALGSLLVGLAVPVRTGSLTADVPAFLCGMFFLAVLIGVVESSMARLRLVRVPKMLVSALALAVLALVMVLR